MPRTKNKQKKLHVKKGDRVRVIAGNEKGKEGKVLRVFPERERVIVEGVNMRVRHMKPNATYPQGGRVEREIPVHVSNVMPLDSDGEVTRIGRRAIADADTGRRHWVRFAKTTDEELDQ